MDILKYIGMCLAPVALFIASDILLSLAVKKISSRPLRLCIYAALGFLISLGIYVAIQIISQQMNFPLPKVGNALEALTGLSTGIIVSLSCGISFGLRHKYPLKIHKLFAGIQSRILGSTFAALGEEVVFRAGIVHFTVHFFGPMWGLLAGSIPFGFLHLLGNFFGQKRKASQIFGITLAGLMLTLVYLNFGLIAAFLCHLVWNSTVDGWAQVYGTSSKETTNDIEGSWLTCAVLIKTSLVLLALYFSLVL